MTRTFAILLALVFSTSANSQIVNMVGIGSTQCERFNTDKDRELNFERVYFAWAQGLMSGIILRAPPGRMRN